MGLLISPLFIYTPDKSRSVAKIFISHPVPTVEKNLGIIFGVLEVETKNHHIYNIINDLALEIEKNYYNGMMPQNSINPLEENFEIFLQKINQRLTEVIQNTKLSTVLNEFSLLVGIIRGEELIFSHHGEMEVLLVHQKKDRTYQLVDILEISGNKEAGNALVPTKLLNYITSGQIVTKDTLLFGSRNFLDYFSTDKLKQTLSSLEPDQAVEHFRTILWEASVNTTFAAIIAKKTDSTETDPFKTRSHSQASIDNLLDTKQSTTDVLDSSFKLYPPKWLTGITNKLTTSEKDRSPRERRISTKLGTAQVYIYYFFKGLWVVLTKIGTLAIQLFVAIWWIIQSLAILLYGLITAPRQTLHNLENNLVTTIAVWVQKIKHLSLLQKIILPLGIVLLILFIQSLSTMKTNQQKQIEQQKIDSLTAEIKSYENSIEANIITNNTANAVNYLKAAQALLAQLPETASNKAELSKELTTYSYKIRKVIDISNAPILATLNILPTDITGMTILEDRAYVLSNKDVTMVNLTNKEVTSLAATNLAFNLTATDNTSFAVLINSQGELSKIEKNAPDAVKAAEITYAEDEKYLTSISTYNDWLYVLSKESGKIYRHPPVLTGFGQPLKWLTTTIDFSDSLDIAIDGAVYVLNKQGAVKKLYAGKPVDTFSVEAVEPMVQNAARIITDYTYKNIYILEPAASRVIVYDKGGKFLHQYYNANLTDLRGMVVRENTQKMYLLNGTNLIEVNLE